MPAEEFRFVGRAEALEKLDKLIERHRAEGTVVAIHAIDGMAGVGKTALALHVAHQYADRYPDGSIFLDLQGYTPGAEPRTVESALDELLAKSGADRRAAQSDGMDAATLWRSVMAGRRTIVVLDNARDSDHVRPLLPGAAGCLVLITSRVKLTGLPHAEPVPLNVLSLPDACELFASVAGRERCQDRAALTDAVNACGLLPLAITIAAASVRHDLLSLGELVTEMQARRDRPLDAFQPEDADDATPAGLRAAFEVSYERLAVPLRAAFVRLGLYPGNDIGEHAMAALLDCTTVAARKLLRRLATHNLLGRVTSDSERYDVDEFGPRYRMHDLVRAYARERATAEVTLEDGAQAFDRLHDYHWDTFDVAAALLEGKELAPLSERGLPLTAAAQVATWFGLERGALVAFLIRMSEQATSSTLARLADRLGVILGRLGYVSDARASLTLGADMSHDLGDTDGEAYARLSLAHLDQLVGDYRQANDGCAAAADLFRETRNKSGEAEALVYLATIDRARGTYQLARRRYRTAADMFRKTGNQGGVARALLGLADVDRLRDARSQARHGYTAVIRIFREIRNREGEAQALLGLSAIDRLTGDYPAARRRIIASDGIYRDIGDRNGQAQALAELADVDRLTGDYPAARRRLTDAADIYRDIGNRRGEARVLFGLSHTLLCEEHDEEARHIFGEAAAIYQELGLPLPEVRAIEADA